ncbi:MAG: hypothetical protein KF716_25625 [Anaerolineae bacterium]|nr:hypothetical protein [Anaerolineae bacterium]
MQKSRWFRSCLVLISFCLVVMFVFALMINENTPASVFPQREAVRSEVVATASPTHAVNPLSSPTVFNPTIVLTTPEFVGGAGVALTSEAIIQSTKVETYRDGIRATWTTAAQTMQPLLIQMTLTATLWQK